jgi:hypothetical protein
MRYHVRNFPKQGYKYGEWVYEDRPLTNAQHSISLVGRILIGKIENEERLIRIIKETPIVQHNPNRRCRTWCADVLRR